MVKVVDNNQAFNNLILNHLIKTSERCMIVISADGHMDKIPQQLFHKEWCILVASCINEYNKTRTELACHQVHWV